MIFLHNSSCCRSPQWADVRCMNQAARHRALATWSHLIQTAVGWNSPVCYITKAVGWWEFLLQCCSVGAEIGQSLQQLRRLWPCSKATAALSIHYWALSALNRDQWVSGVLTVGPQRRRDVQGEDLVLGRMKPPGIEGRGDYYLRPRKRTGPTVV